MNFFFLPDAAVVDAALPVSLFPFSYCTHSVEPVLYLCIECNVNVCVRARFVLFKVLYEQKSTLATIIIIKTKEETRKRRRPHRPVPYVDVACTRSYVYQNEKLTAENNGNTAKIK